MTKKKEENFKSILEEIGESEVIPDTAPLQNIITSEEFGESLRTIIEKFAILEEKFDRTFNNHTVIHGRFRRGRKTINK